VARTTRAARAPKAKSCAMSFTCPSFTCRLRAALGAACVCWAWVPPLEDDEFHDEHLHASVLRSVQHVPRYVLRHVLRHVLRRVVYVPVLQVLVLHVSPKGKRGGQHACVGCGLEGHIGR